MSDSFWMGLFGLMGTIVTTAASLIIALLIKANRKLDQTHDLVNSTSIKLNQLTGESEFAKGVIQGTAEEKQKGESPQAVVVVNEPNDPVPTTKGVVKDKEEK